MRAVAYIRVSTEEQNPENQRLYLERWAKDRSIKIIKFYTDIVSGYMPPWERDAFKQMIEELNVTKPDILLVYEISRLVRNFTELFKLLDIVEGKLGLIIVSASERESMLQNVDGIYRQFLRAVLAFVANMEREFIRQRTKIAMERARAAGKIKNVIDYNKDIIERVVEMYKNGASLGEISKTFGISTYKVRRLLSYAGIYRPNELTCPRCFARLQTLERNIKKNKIVERRYCSNCGYEEAIER